MPRPPRDVSHRVTQAVTPVVNRAVGEGRRRAAADRAARILPGRSRPLVDFTGWNAPEFRDFMLAAGGTIPQRRAGRQVVTDVNALAGQLPVTAVLLARAITDTAPPVGAPVNAILLDVLERYLPESLDAYRVSTRSGSNPLAGSLLVQQLQLLHEVASNIERAQLEHNERDLQIQADFLRERFPELRSNGLDLDHERVVPSLPGGVDPTPLAPSALEQARAYLRPDRDPVVQFPTTDDTWQVLLRLALPKGQTATLGVVQEALTGATTFEHQTGRRRFATRRSTGFASPQVDVMLPIRFGPVRRFMVYATSLTAPAPTDTVLFVREADRAQAELTTLLTNRVTAPLTVIASGYRTRDGVVLRNESLLFPDLRTATRAFGYGNITWLDAHTPFV